MIAVRCPADLAPMRARHPPLAHLSAGEFGPVLRELRRMTDPLFRRAGLNLDG
jgi:hypothetical protein